MFCGESFISAFPAKIRLTGGTESDLYEPLKHVSNIEYAGARGYFESEASTASFRAEKMDDGRRVMTVPESMMVDALE